jgi:hypothetical protein
MLDTNTGSWFSTSITEDEANKEMPLWLFEGLPDYISLKVSHAGKFTMVRCFFEKQPN